MEGLLIALAAAADKRRDALRELECLDTAPAGDGNPQLTDLLLADAVSAMNAVAQDLIEEAVRLNHCRARVVRDHPAYFQGRA